MNYSSMFAYMRAGLFTPSFLTGPLLGNQRARHFKAQSRRDQHCVWRQHDHQETDAQDQGYVRSQGRKDKGSGTQDNR